MVTCYNACYNGRWELTLRKDGESMKLADNEEQALNLSLLKQLETTAVIA